MSKTAMNVRIESETKCFMFLFCFVLLFCYLLLFILFCFYCALVGHNILK